MSQLVPEIKKSKRHSGQDLIFLREWIDEHPQARPISVAHHQIDTSAYLGDRTCMSGNCAYVAADAYSLVHNDSYLWQHELVGRVGTSFFIFRKN